MKLRKTVDFGSLHSSTREQFVALVIYGLTVTLWVACGSRTSTPNIVAATVLPIWLLLWMSYFYKQALAYIILFFGGWITLYSMQNWHVRRWLGPSQPIKPNSQLARICAGVADEAAVGPVRFRIGKRSSQTGLAYGFPGHRAVVFGGGLKQVARIEPEKAEFLIAHEISHLRHGDIDIGYLSWSLYWSIVITMMAATILTFVNIPLIIRSTAVVDVFEIAKDTVGALIALFGFIFVAHLYYTGALRSREHYADVAAQQLTNAKVPPEAMFENETDSSWLATLMRHHPSRAQRRAYLHNPTRLLRVNASEAFSIAFICGFLVDVVTDIYTDFEIAYERLAKLNLSDPLVSFASSTITGWVSAGVIVILIASLMSSQHLRIATRHAMGFSSRRQFIAEEALVLVAGVVGFSAAFYISPIALYQAVDKGGLDLSEIGQRAFLVTAGSFLFGVLFIVVDAFYTWAIWFVTREKSSYALTAFQRIALSSLWFLSACEFGGTIALLFPGIFPFPYALYGLDPSQTWLLVLPSVILGVLTLFGVLAVVVSGTRGARLAVP
ncbi:M48 family metalloprotease [Bosea sp. 685]|uniref:M48 family metalloprotease n=1 Tax=Bosea sp. 685 TaxID=3080057 RepID=UPI002892EF06|nr:M48 family metalloprotease [Bosea sp. 685]WNJ89590.1 M48 family metalloprotease [Bosea sp. 685]